MITSFASQAASERATVPVQPLLHPAPLLRVPDRGREDPALRLDLPVPPVLQPAPPRVLDAGPSALVRVPEVPGSLPPLRPVRPAGERGRCPVHRADGLLPGAAAGRPLRG